MAIFVTIGQFRFAISIRVVRSHMSQTGQHIEISHKRTGPLHNGSVGCRHLAGVDYNLTLLRVVFLQQVLFPLGQLPEFLVGKVHTVLEGTVYLHVGHLRLENLLVVGFGQTELPFGTTKQLQPDLSFRLATQFAPFFVPLGVTVLDFGVHLIEILPDLL